MGRKRALGLQLFLVIPAFQLKAFCPQLFPTGVTMYVRYPINWLAQFLAMPRKFPALRRLVGNW